MTAAVGAQASSTAGNRFEVDVPPGTAVVLGATRRDAGDETYRAVRYDRVSDGVVRQGGRSELRRPVELPAVRGHSYLYVDAVHGAGEHPPKSKLSSERIGDGVWRLHFSDGAGGIGGLFGRPEYEVTVRFRKLDEFQRAAATPGAAKGPRAATRPAAGAAAGAAASNGPAWARPNDSVACGELRVRLTAANGAPRAAGDPAGSDGGPAANQPLAPALRLVFTVENASATRKLTFRPWRGEDFPVGGNHIRDNFGNTYKLIPADPLAAPADATVPLYPGKSATAELAFEAPVDSAQYLEVELPAANVGGFKSVPLRFRIPASAVHRRLPPQAP
jgi:hypothetical protein